MTAKQFHPGELSDLRRRAEEEFGAAEAKAEELPPTAELKRLVQELRVHQIELEMQNEQLRRTHSESTDLYRTLVENVNLGITLVGRQHRIMAVNGVHAKMIGRPVDECIGQECFRVFEKREAACPHCPGIRAMETGKPAEVEITGAWNHGVPCDIRIQAFPVHGLDGRPEGFIEVVEDITERKEVEKQLAHFSAIVNSSQDAIIGKTLDGIVTSWNPGAERLYGFTAAEMIGRPISNLTPLDRSDEIRSHLSRLANGGSVEQYDTVRRRKDGTLVDVSLTLSPIKNHAGKVIGASAIAHDITDRKRAEELIRASEERLSNIVENAAEIIYTLSLNGVFTFVSPSWTKKLGHEVADVEGHTFAPFIHPEDVPACQAALQRIVTTGEPQRRAYRIRHKDESWRWHRSLVSLIKASQNRPAYFVGVAEDVTEQIRAEAKLRDSEEKYRTYINNSPTGVFVADSNGQFVEVNTAACCLLGYSEAELTRMRIPDIVAVEDIPSAMAMHHELTQVSSAVRGEFCFIRKDGSRVFMSVDAIRVQEDRLVEFCIDITQRVNAERSLQQQSDTLRQSNQRLEEACGKAEAASRSKSEFLANMSHELRTPMTAILGFSDILAENCVKAESIEAAQIIKRNGEHLLNVINDILDLSKIEAGKYTVGFEICSPSQIAAETISLMKVRADAKGLPLTLEMQGDIPENISTDPIHLRQILVNLIGNSIKFTELGGVRVVMRRETTHDNDAKLIFDVIDTGIGMSAEQMELLFRPFSQVDGSTRRRFGGTGLGLAISKRLAEMLDGDICVQSSPGEGSTFTLSIRIGKLSKAVGTPEPSKPQTTSKPVVNAQSKLNCRVLLAEDGPDNQRLIAFLLRKAGAEVELAENGQIALDLALAARQSRNSFDMILMDMQMPVMDGYEATEKLRNAGFHEPIIALTAHAMTEDRQECIDAGCDDYISKPIDPKKLVGLLEPWVAMESSPA